MTAENPSFRQIEEQQDSGHLATVLVERSDGTISTGRYEGVSSHAPGNYNIGVEGRDGSDSVTHVSGDKLTDEYQAELAERLAGKPLRQEMGSLAVGAISLVAPESKPTPSSVEHTAQVTYGEDGLIEMPNWGAAGASSAEATPTQPEAPTPTIEDALNDLKQDLPADEVRKLENYSRYLYDKANAQSSGDGEGSTRAGQYAGQEYRSMSPDAQQIASHYASLWQRR